MDAPEPEPRAIALCELGERLSELRLRQPAAIERVGRSMSRHGQLVAVTAFDDGELLQVVDGFKRVQAAGQLGWRSVQVSVVALSEAEAIAATAAMHQHRELTELEEGWAVRALYREHAMSQGAIGHLMGKDKSWVSRRLMLAESLEPSVQADVRLGLLAPRAAVTVAALPRGNQRQAAELVMQRGMTTRRTEALVRALRQLESDEARQRAMQQWPADAPVAPKGGVKRRARTAAEQLMADVATLRRVGVRLEVQLLDRPLASLGPDGAAQARDALGELGELLGGLERAIGRAMQMRTEADEAVAKS